jgi:hypothetical protein
MENKHLDVAERDLRNRFIWRGWVVKFGIPVALVATLTTAFHNEGLSVGTLLSPKTLFAVSVGTGVGAVVGGYIVGTLMWWMFGEAMLRKFRK